MMDWFRSVLLNTLLVKHLPIDYNVKGLLCFPCTVFNLPCLKFPHVLSIRLKKLISMPIFMATGQLLMPSLVCINIYNRTDVLLTSSTQLEVQIITGMTTTLQVSPHSNVFVRIKAGFVQCN